MKKIIFVIMILMAMLSCSQNEDIGKGDVAGVTADELQVIDNKMYRYGDRNPYTGNLITKDSKERIVLVEAVNRGVSEGQVKSYYTSGKLKEKYTVKNEKIEGEYSLRSQDGSILVTAMYKGGEKENEKAVTTKDRKAFTGTYTETYDNGNVSQTIKFVDGVRGGETIFYYESGKIKEKIPYVRGLREGNYFFYNETGEVTGKGVLVNDKKEGQWLVYDENDRTLIEKNYVNNLEEGPYRVYFEDGNTKAEGIYRNGKQ